MLPFAHVLVSEYLASTMCRLSWTRDAPSSKALRWRSNCSHA